VAVAGSREVAGVVVVGWRCLGVWGGRVLVLRLVVGISREEGAAVCC
jgi:hypothetical protein